MEPIVWEDLMPQKPDRVMRGRDPDTGEFTLKGSEANHYSLNFTPKYPDGMGFEQIWERISSLPDGEERDSWRKHIGTNTEFGYFYDLSEAMRMIELARTRPVVTDLPDTILHNAGFAFKHSFFTADGAGAMKVYTRHVRTGMFQINRSESHVHGTFEFNKNHNGWINLFRIDQMETWHDGSRHPYT
ncbi:MAG: hypothetical protein EOP83_25835, partial [Verrucomicrobiaceae bacterium]